MTHQQALRKLKLYLVGVQLNNYFKHLGKEDLLQVKVFNYIKIRYPKILTFHVANEAKRTPYERWSAKVKGLTRGIPDIIVIYQKEYKLDGYRGVYSGLAIELKVIYKNGTKNKCTKDQEEVLLNMGENGFLSLVCWDFETAIEAVNKYLDFE